MSSRARKRRSVAAADDAPSENGSFGVAATMAKAKAGKKSKAAAKRR